MRESLIKYRAPSSYDHAPYGTLWKEIINDDQIILYIQADLSEENKSEWLPLGLFLERIYKQLYPDEESLLKALELLIQTTTSDSKY